ncbi:unnamed protein product [Arabidopsis thaliana]|uniref:(thale cress) hypothetical protein n=1 Tax=Arabidopsis thaliana TaxID=3702 RepID=A0A7G2EQ24_ARATH|nr:unnamed protein product [Arabidopsis thaliana]
MLSSNVSETCTRRKRGTKRKIEIEKRFTKEQRSIACSKRRLTLFSKAADLCLLSGANMVVFVTSPDENSYVVYSFSGYSSASEIVHCNLNDKSPPKITQSNEVGFWWEDLIVEVSDGLAHAHLARPAVGFLFSGCGGLARLGPQTKLSVSKPGPQSPADIRVGPRAFLCYASRILEL